jgi:hypothetical protein
MGLSKEKHDPLKRLSMDIKQRNIIKLFSLSLVNRGIFANDPVILL